MQVGPRAVGRPWVAEGPRRRLLGRVGDYRDLEPALVGAVEQLIDFVTEA